ncbi:MAG: efflux RND transporter periplasmic adaptor subunit [Spirochaetales bacterium]|nr:efflux RND transporter periplasmic adaptor subunit [Spirochaetales bacterium]
MTTGKKKMLIAAGLVIVAALVTVSIISKNKNSLIEVSPFTVELQDFIREVTANGEITSKKNTKIYAAVEAAVNEVPVEEGQIVQRGQILIILDKESLDNKLINAENAVINSQMAVRAELLNLRTAYSSAHTAKDQAERDFNRTAELHKIGSISDEELRMKEEAFFIASENLDSGRQKLNFREGRPLDDQRTSSFLSDSKIVENSPEVAKALSDLDIAGKNIKYYEIKAESGGTITDLNVDENSVVELGMMLAEIHDETQLVVDALVDEVDLSYIAVGQEVKITSDSFIGKELSGRVSRIAPMIKKINDSRVCEIEVDLLENPDKAARIGASASIYIIVEEKDQSPSIPVEAYFVEKGKKWVFYLEPPEGYDAGSAEFFTARKREIETGILGIENIEVTKGLFGDDLIIEGRIPGVEDGTEVKIIIDEDEDDTEDSTGR